MIAVGYDHNDILQHVNFTLEITKDLYRIEVLNAMIAIAKGVSNAKGSSTSNNL